MPRRTWVPIIAVMGIGTAWTISIWGIIPRPTVDTSSYQHLAGWLRDGIPQLPWRTFGYPLVLLVTGSADHLTPALFLVQLGCHLGAVWVAVLISRRFELPTVATLMMVALLVTPEFMEKVTVGGTEAVCEVLLALTVLLYVRWREDSRLRDALLCGFAIAAAAYMRPTYQALGLILAAMAFARLWRRGERRQGVRAAGALAAGSLVLIGGMVLFNVVRFQYVGFSPMLGWNLSTKTALFVEELSDSEPLKPVLVAARNDALSTNPKGGAAMYIWPLIDSIPVDLGMDRASASTYMLDLNMRLIRSHPGAYLDSVAHAAGTYVLPADSLTSYVPRRLGLTFLLVYVLFAVAFLAQCFGVVGLGFARRLGASIAGPFERSEARAAWRMSIGLIVYSAVVSIAVDVGFARVRTPTDLLIVLATFGGSWMVYAAWRGR